MKKLMLACCFVIGAASMSFAQGGQGGGRPQMDPAQRAARLKDQLKLTDDQVTKITAIYTADAPKRDSIMKASAGATDRTAMMTAFRAFSDAEQAKIKAVLTPEQADAFAKMPQFGRRGGQGGQGGQGGGQQR